MTEVEVLIRAFLNEKQWAYTKTIYKAVDAKSYGYSLNKFRKLLELMVLDKNIKYKHNGNPHPYWYLGDV